MSNERLLDARLLDVAERGTVPDANVISLGCELGVTSLGCELGVIGA